MTAATTTAEGERLRRVSPLRLFFSRPESGAIAGAVIVFLIFAVLSALRGDIGKGFLSIQGAASYLEVTAQVGILGAAVSLLMIAGEFDLSVGSMIGAAGLLLGLLIVQWGVPPTIAIILTFAFALAVGAFNGWLRIKTGLPSFLVTLGMLLILRGAGIGFTRAITSQTIVSGITDKTAGDPIVQLFTAKVTIAGGDFKIILLWWVAAVIVATWVLTRTRFGNWIFSVGGSEQAARYVGVPVNRVRIILFMTTAGSAALLAVIQVLSFGSADVLRGTNKEFEAIITAVVGGTLLTGGYGSALGSAFGAFILGTTQLGINFVGINSDWYQVVLGTILLLAVLVNTYLLRRASGAR
ncbi:MAG TPA: ABC transporter permease [Candidatus Limnocylindrales bacterium]|jgi:simple sugar transport system permease protein